MEKTSTDNLKNIFSLFFLYLIKTKQLCESFCSNVYNAIWEMKFTQFLLKLDRFCLTLIILKQKLIYSGY